MSMSADISAVRGANASEFKSYQPDDNLPTEEQVAEARADEINKFNRLDSEINRGDDDDLGLEEPGDGLTTTSTPEQIFAEGRAASRAAAERAAAKGPARKADASAEDDDLALPEKPADQDNDDSALRRAELKLALVRSGFDDDQIADMEKKGTFEAKALRRQAALKADDEAHSFLREQRKAADSAGKTENHGVQPRQVPAVEPLDVEPLVKPLAAALGLEEAGASTLKQFAENLVNAVTKNAEKQIQRGLDGVAETQAAQAGQQVFVDAQVEVGKRIPDLLDPTKFGKALKFAASLIKDAREDPDHPVNEHLARFATPREKAGFLLETFANVSMFKSKPSGEKVQAEGERTLRAHARSTVGDRTRTAPLTQRERDVHAFNDSMAKQGL